MSTCHTRYAHLTHKHFHCDPQNCTAALTKENTTLKPEHNQLILLRGTSINMDLIKQYNHFMLENSVHQ